MRFCFEIGMMAQLIHRPIQLLFVTCILPSIKITLITVRILNVHNCASNSNKEFIYIISRLINGSNNMVYIKYKLRVNQ